MHSHLSLCILFIMDLTLPLAFQVEHQAADRAALQQVGASLPLMAEEQQTLQAAGEEYKKEEKDPSNYNKMSSEILEEYANLARE